VKPTLLDILTCPHDQSALRLARGTYASRHTEDELRGWCDECGLSIAHMDVSDSGLSVLARRES
jgi:uncharacterized protein YbaR (Trm112 family)